jgi:hypothetical protein
MCSAWLCFAATTSRSHAPRALFVEAIDRSASGSEIPVAVIGGFPALWQHVHVDFRFGSQAAVERCPASRPLLCQQQTLLSLIRESAKGPEQYKVRN